MDTACAVSCGLADFELRRLGPAGASRRAPLSGRSYGGNCLRRFFRRTDRDANLWRGRLRPKRLPALQGAPADFCQKVEREYHRFLDSARHPGRRTIGSQWCIRRLTEERPPRALKRIIRRTLLRAVCGSSEGPPL